MHLSAVSRGGDPSCPVDIETHIVASAERADPGVHPHPNSDLPAIRPHMVGQSALGVGGRGNRIGC